MPKPVVAILVHGMGRTPLSLFFLAHRLSYHGIRPHLFWYFPALETLAGCRARLIEFIRFKAGTDQFIVIGHSLGTVLLRSVISDLKYFPLACFFIAPPAIACRAARRLSGQFFYKIFTGEMGQLLADEKFMNSLPIPACPTQIFSGTGGPRGNNSPFGNNENDGLLMVNETRIKGIPMKRIAGIHTFLMNNKIVARDIIRFVRRIPNE